MKYFDPSSYTTASVNELHDHWVLSDNIVYTDLTDQMIRDACRLSVYYPTNQINTPVLVYFHGGGLTGGSYTDIPELYKHLGCVLVSADYRKYPLAKYPEFISDAANAVVWAKNNAQKYNGNSNMIFVAGHSAGAYITTMLALKPEFIAKASQNNTLNSDIRAYFSISGEMTTHFAVCNERGFPKNKIVVDDASPIYNVSTDTPPIFALTGGTGLDIGNRAADNKLFGDAMKKAGNKNIIQYEIPGADHGSIIDIAYAYMLSFIRKTLQEDNQGKK